MSRQLRSNFDAPDIHPLPNQIRINHPPQVNMAAAAPEVWTENPLCGDFNPGTTTEQKIFMEKTKGLKASKRLALTSSDARDIMEILKVKENQLGPVITTIPTVYTLLVGSEPMNLIHQSPSIPLEMTQRAAHAHFGTPLDAGDPIPPRPWITAALDPVTVPAVKLTFYDQVNGNGVVELI